MLESRATQGSGFVGRPIASVDRELFPLSAGLDAWLEHEDVPLRTLTVLGTVLTLVSGTGTQRTGLLNAAREPRVERVFRRPDSATTLDG